MRAKPLGFQGRGALAGGRGSTCRTRKGEDGATGFFFFFFFFNLGWEIGWWKFFHFVTCRFSIIESGCFKGGGRWGAGHWFTNNELWLGNNLFWVPSVRSSLTGEICVHELICKAFKKIFSCSKWDLLAVCVWKDLIRWMRDVWSLCLISCKNDGFEKQAIV